MIKVIYKPNDYSISMEGHAGYAEPGKDIVCSAASCLANTLRMETVINKELRGELSDVRENSPIYVVLHPRTRRERSKARWLLNTIFTGYWILAKQYPENVQAIKEVWVNDRSRKA